MIAQRLPVTELTGQPGTRAPHVWLERKGERLSTIDLFGRRYVLLTGSDGGAWVAAARSLTDTPVDVYRIGGDGNFADPDGRWPAAYGITNDGAVLVRPDGFVAWRGVGTVDDPARVLTSALSEVLARESAVISA